MIYSNSFPLSYGNQKPLSYNDLEGYESPQYNQVQQQGDNQPTVYELQSSHNEVHNNYYNNNQGQKKSSSQAAFTGAGIGLVGGAIAGACKKNPYMINGIPSNTFAKHAYERYLKHAPEVERNGYAQCNEVLNTIDKMKNTDELKTLLNNNPEASKEVSTALNKTTEEYISGVSDTNLGANKDMIKKKLGVANESRFQHMKNEISRAWNGEKRIFVKPDNMDQNTFRAIKRTAASVRAKFIATYAAIAAVAAGIITFAVHKIVTSRKQHTHQ